MVKKQKIQKDIAFLEKENERMFKELLEADLLLRHVGFDNGLETVKEAAREIIRAKRDSDIHHRHDVG